MSEGITLEEAEKILFPNGMCVSTLNGDRCIIPASTMHNGKGFCDYHLEVMKGHEKLCELLMRG